MPTSLDRADAYALMKRSNRKALDLKGVRVSTLNITTEFITEDIENAMVIDPGNGLNNRMGGKLKILSFEVNWWITTQPSSTSAITIAQLWIGQQIGSYPDRTTAGSINRIEMYWPDSEVRIAPWLIRRGYVNKNFKIFRRHNMQFRKVASTNNDLKQGNNVSQCGSLVVSANDLGQSKMLDMYYYQVPGKSDTVVNPLVIGWSANVRLNIQMKIRTRITFAC